MITKELKRGLILGLALLVLPMNAYAAEKKTAAKAEKSEQEQLADDYRARRSGKAQTQRTCPCASSNGTCSCGPHDGYGYGYGYGYGGYYGAGSGYGPGWSRNYHYSDMPTTGYTAPTRR